MLRKFKVIYIALSQRQREVVIEATSKYDAKQKFHFRFPDAELIRTEVDYGNK